MAREGQIGHLLGARGLVGLPAEVALRGAAAATRALVPVSGLSGVEARLKVDREPLRAMAADHEVAKCKRARANAKAALQGGPSPQSLVVAGDGGTPLTSVAGEATAHVVNGPIAQRDLADPSGPMTQRSRVEFNCNGPSGPVKFNDPTRPSATQWRSLNPTQSHAD